METGKKDNYSVEKADKHYLIQVIKVNFKSVYPLGNMYSWYDAMKMTYTFVVFLSQIPNTNVIMKRNIRHIPIEDVLVNLGCHNKILWTEWLNQQKYFLTVLEAFWDEGSSIVEFWKGLLPGLQMIPSCSVLIQWTESSASSFSPYQGASPIRLEFYPMTSFNLYHLLKGPISTYSNIEV